MVTDSGRFRFREVSGDTMRLAGLMLDQGVDTEKLYANLYLEDFEHLKFKAYVYKSMKITPNGVAYLVVDKAMREKFNLSLEATSACISFMDSIKGCLCWIAFIENDDAEQSIRVRLRSRFVPVSDIGEKYRGGGHACACGATLYSKKEIRSLLKDVDTLVNIAGIYYSENLVKAAIKCGVRRVILVHTTGIYSKYKAAGELYRNIEERVYALCRENGIILSVCRPTMIYGNTSDKNVAVFIKMVDKFPIMPVVNGARYILQPVHYEDLAKGYFGVLLNEEKTANKDYVLSGGSVIELREMLKIIGENLGKKVHFISCPFAIAYFGACALYYLTGKKKDYREKVQRLCEPRAYSHEDAKNDFGYSPVSFQEGIVAEVKQYLAAKK
jgi:nucleoside-diphosphate-sugar epimerase